MDILERLNEDYFAKKSHNTGGYEMNELGLGASMVSPLPQKVSEENGLVSMKKVG